MNMTIYDEQFKHSQNSVNNVSSQSIPSFLLKTYQILQNANYADIICWTKNGQGFIVKKVKEFSQKILPIHFRHSNYTSFVRQLNMYDFHKTRQENQQNAFKNFLFKRGRKDLLKQIQRKDYKKNKQTRNQSVPEKILIQSPVEKKIDKDYSYIKQFYRDSINTLNGYSSKFQIKSSQLAQIKEINLKQQKIMSLLDLLLQTKRLNQNSYRDFQFINKKWSSFISTRQLNLKNTNSDQEQLKQEDKSQKQNKLQVNHKQTAYTLHH